MGEGFADYQDKGLVAVNDCDAGTLGEYVFGAGRGSRFPPGRPSDGLARFRGVRESSLPGKAAKPAPMWPVSNRRRFSR